MSRKFLLSAVLGTCLLAGSAMAQGPMGCEGPGPGCGKMLREGRCPGMGMGVHIGWLIQNKEKALKAGLTEEQVNALQTVFYKNKEEMINLRAEQEKARLEVEKIMQSDTPDEAALMKAVDQLGLADTQLKKSHMLMQLKIREVVGKDKYNELVRKQQMMFKHGMEGKRDHKGKDKGANPPPPAEAPTPIDTPTAE
jgi:Spy/CpxP family protein refolding chaperone